MVATDSSRFSNYVDEEHIPSDEQGRRTRRRRFPNACRYFMMEHHHKTWSSTYFNGPRALSWAETIKEASERSIKALTRA